MSMNEFRPENFNISIHMILVCLYGQRDALIAWKQLNDRLEGDAAALRGNLLNLAIENLSDMVISPLEEVERR